MFTNINLFIQEIAELIDLENVLTIDETSKNKITFFENMYHDYLDTFKISNNKKEGSKLSEIIIVL